MTKQLVGHNIFSMKRNIVLAFNMLICLSLLSQAEPKIYLESTTQAIPFSEGISVEDLKSHVNKLASEEFEGRETGTTGQKKAAKYIADVFSSNGLPAIGESGSYFQKISFISENWNKISMAVNDTFQLRHLWNYYAYPSTNTSLPETTINEVVFLGFGIDDAKYSDYKKADVRNKAIIIYDGEPIDKKGISKITRKKELSEWSLNWRKKLQVAKAKGVQHVFIIDRNFRTNVADARKVILNRRLEYGEAEVAKKNYAPNTFISSEVARSILNSRLNKVLKTRAKAENRGKSKPVVIPTKIKIFQDKNTRSLIGENVLGFIEGTDEELKNEVVVVTAHYDHLGKRGDAIYYGADDNASGTSCALEICQAFVEAKKVGSGPKRSVLVMLVSGEEKGLLGSAYYVDHPVFPLANTVANVNVDMVGRIDNKHLNNPNYIYVIGSDRLSTELHQINELANEQHVKIELDYTYNAEDDPNRYYYRSDHYNFAERGIPAIFFFNGTHSDYHRTSDTPDKIQFDKMAKIAQLIFFTTWELANRTERIVVDVKN